MLLISFIHITDRREYHT